MIRLRRVPGPSARLLAILAFSLLIVPAQADEKAPAKKPSAEELRKRLSVFRSLPYTSVTPEEVDLDVSGVVKYVSDRTWPGYNIYCCRLSSEVLLIDMEGEVVHRWSYPDKRTRVWDHAIMLDNGDVLVIRKFHDLIRLDWDSRLIWRLEINSHHEVVELADGSFYIVARELHTHRGLRIRFPAIVRLAEDGTELERWSTYDNLEAIKASFDQRSFIDRILDSLLIDEVDPDTWEPMSAHAESVKAEIDAWPRRHDQFHMNTITIIPENPLGKRDGRFREGNLLICFRNVDQIAVLERDTKEILWVWGEGSLERPHHPTMVEGGNILIFDNGWNRKYSRVIELNPLTEEIEWEYTGMPPESFFTAEKGSAQRLPNGNTLICEGDRGRAFEVTRDGEIVWDWYNPAMRGKHREQIYRMMRIAPEIVEPLLEGHRASPQE